MSQKEEKNGHVLIMRLSAMGDVAMTAPVIAALRAAYPDLRISILTRTFFRPFFREIENLEFIDFEPEGRHKGAVGLTRLAMDINRAGVDSVADLHDVIRTKYIRRILYLLGKKVSVIDKGEDEKKEITRRTRKVLSPLIPMVERYRLTLIKLGFYFDMPWEREHKVYPIPEIIINKAGEKTDEWIGVAPFAKHKGKIYPIPLADELIGLLNEKYRRVFIFGGGDHERSFAEGMEKRHKGVISIIGRLSLPLEMDLISNLDVMITMDSASMHIASLLDVPVVSVWGATHPFVGFYGYGQDPENAVQVEMECRPCSVYGNKPCIFGDYRCLSSVSPESIVKVVEKTLQKNRIAASTEKDVQKRLFGEPASPSL